MRVVTHHDNLAGFFSDTVRKPTLEVNVNIDEFGWVNVTDLLNSVAWQARCLQALSVHIIRHSLRCPYMIIDMFWCKEHFVLDVPVTAH